MYIVKAMRRAGRMSNEGYRQKGGPHGHRGQAKTRHERRTGRQSRWEDS